MLQIGKYRYGLKTGYKGPRKRWVCGLAIPSHTFSYPADDSHLDSIFCGLHEVIKRAASRFGVTPVFTVNSRGNRMIVIGSYKFSLHTDSKKSAGPKKRWVCSYWSRCCRAVVNTLNDDIVAYKEEHNHKSKIIKPSK
ncbi:FLYWCH zinc finger domain-containing protein [Phthorimaea operculella]|nr:FLYWCH zinc finger domain-containing protein [Phthorimaea operculella]